MVLVALFASALLLQPAVGASSGASSIQMDVQQDREEVRPLDEQIMRRDLSRNVGVDDSSGDDDSSNPGLGNISSDGSVTVTAGSIASGQGSSSSSGALSSSSADSIRNLQGKNRSLYSDHADSNFKFENDMPVYLEPSTDVDGDITLDGQTRVMNAYTADQATEQIINEERNNVCMHELSLFACMELYGSYGIRRLLTESNRDIKKGSWERADWMAHDKVQSSKLMKVTFPMSHASGAYDVVGAPDETEVGSAETAASLTQNMDILQQLELGVRALEMDVVVSTAGQLFTTHNGMLNVPLVTVLRDVNRFLNDHVKEVVMLSLRRGKAPSAKTNLGSHASYDTLKEEEDEATTSTATKLPGEQAHRLVQAVLGSHQATHAKLQSLSEASSDPEDPTISEHVDAKARLVYFWNGQQVLCSTRDECSQISGWQAPTRDAPFAFGAPSSLGLRSPEPFCLEESVSNEADPVTKVKHLHAYMLDAKQYLPSPKCYPGGSAKPLTPPIMLVLDAYGFQTDNHEGKKAYATVLEDGEHFMQGEALTARSMAERMNFLLLSWLFLRSPEAENQGRRRAGSAGGMSSSSDDNGDMVFRNANFIALDYVHPAIVHRIVEENQGKGKSCDIAMHCKESGGCHAMSRLFGGDGILNGNCITEAQAQVILQNLDTKQLSIWEKICYYFKNVFLPIVFLIVLCVCCPYNCCCNFRCNSFNMGCLWYKKGYAGPPDGFPAGSGNKDDESAAPAQGNMDAPGGQSGAASEQARA